MFSISDPLFWLSLVAIAVSFFVAFYIPGRVVLGRAEFLKGAAIHVVALTIGIVLWAWQGYLFGSLHIRFFSYVYLLIFIILFLKGRYIRVGKISFTFLHRLDPVLLVLGVVGVFGQTFQYYDYGIKTAQGIITAAHNPFDHIWHAALVQELVKRFPPNEPGISGVLLKDYHYWFNLVTADVVRVFHVPLLQTQFIGMYLLASVLLAFIGYYVGKEIYDNKLFLRILFFFLFFTGDASMWVTLLFEHHMDFTVQSLISNGTKFVDSPPFGYSIIIGLTGYYLLFRMKGAVTKRMLVVIALLFGSLLEFKVYTGIPFMLGLGAYALYYFLRKKFSVPLVFVLASIFGAIVFFPNISSSGGLIYAPFEAPRDFVTQAIFGLSDWQLRWDIYFTHHNYLRLYEYGIFMSVIYFVSQFGLQLIGIFPYKKMRRVLTYDKLIPFYTIIVSGIFLGLQFYQKVGGANIWEFFLPCALVLSFLTALSITLFIEKRKKVVQVILLILFVVIVSPRWVLSVKSDFVDEYFSGFHGIPTAEYASYTYLAGHMSSSDVVLVASEPTISASIAKVITGDDFYFSGIGVRQQTTPEMKKREEVVAEVIKGDLIPEYTNLKKAHVRYIYYPKGVSAPSMPLRSYRLVFQNSAARIIELQ